MKNRGPDDLTVIGRNAPAGIAMGSGPALHLGSSWAALGDGTLGPEDERTRSDPSEPERSCRDARLKADGQLASRRQDGGPPPLPMFPERAYLDDRSGPDSVPYCVRLRGLRAAFGPSLFSLFSRSPPPHPPSLCVFISLSACASLFLRLCRAARLSLSPSQAPSHFLCLSVLAHLCLSSPISPCLPASPIPVSFCSVSL